jgi:hypothetical protein
MPLLLAMMSWLASPALGESAVDRMIVIYQKVLRVRPDDAAIYYKLGDGLYREGPRNRRHHLLQPGISIPAACAEDRA